MQYSIRKKIVFCLAICIMVIITAISVSTEEEVLLENINVPENIYIVLGESADITVTTVPSNATIVGDFYFSSNNVAVAPVSEAGGKIMGCTPGYAKITVTYEDEKRDFSVSKEVNVHVVYRSSEGALPYEPDKWNTSAIQDKRNCYTYAFNLLEISSFSGLPGSGICNYDPGEIAKDGRLGVYQISNSTKATVASGMVNDVIADICALGIGTEEDAIIEVGLNDTIPADRYKVVLYIKYGTYTYTDFHWYRQNDDGTWSHKNNVKPVTNLDENGNIIYDPITCEKYDENLEYVGCYAVKPWISSNE